MKTIAIACVLLATTVHAADVPAAWLCAYTSRVQAIDVDTRESVSVQIRTLRDNDLSSLSTTQIAVGVIRVDFYHNVSNAWFMGSTPPPVTCWAEAPDYSLEMISLAGTNDLVMAYMEAIEPTVLHWRNEQYSMPREAIGRPTPTNCAESCLRTIIWRSSKKPTGTGSLGNRVVLHCWRQNRSA